MKNIYLTLALLLTVSFAFATNGVEKSKKINNVEATVFIKPYKLTQGDLNPSFKLLQGSILEIQFLNNEAI